MTSQNGFTFSDLKAEELVFFCFLLQSAGQLRPARTGAGSARSFGRRRPDRTEAVDGRPGQEHRKTGQEGPADVTEDTASEERRVHVHVVEFPTHAGCVAPTSSRGSQVGFVAGGRHVPVTTGRTWGCVPLDQTRTGWTRGH